MTRTDAHRRRDLGRGDKASAAAGWHGLSGRRGLAGAVLRCDGQSEMVGPGLNCRNGKGRERVGSDSQRGQAGQGLERQVVKGRGGRTRNGMSVRIGQVGTG